jgi:tryptophanyl-tRNA synthetase
MSKSMGNTIGLMETDDEIWAKLRPAMTDPQRVRRTDPGRPEVCNIYQLHKAFSPPETVDHVAVQCSTAGWGCMDCKKVLHGSMIAELTPIRARAQELSDSPARVLDALADGARVARALARETIAETRERMGLGTVTPPGASSITISTNIQPS